MDTPSIPDLSPEEARKVRNRMAQARYRAKNRQKRRAQNQSYYARNAERLRQKARDARQEDPEKSRAIDHLYKSTHQTTLRAANKRRYWADPEGERLRAETWRAEHPEANQLQQRRWRQMHRDLVHAQHQRRRARVQASPVNDFTAAQWRALCKALGYHCVYCGKRFPFKQLTQDHITPLSKGGSHTLANILPACIACNSGKQDRDVPNAVQPFLLLPEEDAAAD